MPTVIPTNILDALIDEGKGDQTIQFLRDQQIIELPFDCPNCEDGQITIVDPATGVTSSASCPLCGGMGRTSVEYTKVCDSSHWQAV